MGEKQRTERTFAGSLHVQGTATGVPKVDRLALTASDTAGAIFNWMNPVSGPVLVVRTIIDVVTPATNACSISAGTGPSIPSANLIDTLDVHSAAGAFDNLSNPGSGGKTSQLVAAGNYLTGSKASGATAGLVGQAYIEYIRLY